MKVELTNQLMQRLNVETAEGANQIDKKDLDAVLGNHRSAVAGGNVAEQQKTQEQMDAILRLLELDPNRDGVVTKQDLEQMSSSVYRQLDASTQNITGQTSNWQAILGQQQGRVSVAEAELEVARANGNKEDIQMAMMKLSEERSFYQQMMSMLNQMMKQDHEMAMSIIRNMP